MSSNPTLATAAFKLSSQQERAWLQHEAGVPTFAQCVIAMDGGVDAGRLARALQQLVSEYEILHTVFRKQTGIKLPFQVIQRDAAFRFETSTDPADSLLQRDREAARDLQNGPTLCATHAGSKLLLTLPAFCADGSTLRNLFVELATKYRNQSADG